MALPRRTTGLTESVLIFGCLLTFLIASSLQAAPPAFGAAPNIVIILTDDQGYGEMSCHGNTQLPTPNLDRLHRESFRFTDFHVSPTCAPTRAALLTGRHEFRSGVTHTIFERERLNLSAKTLAQSLQQRGYATGLFGKWHLGDEEAYQPQRRGFDETLIHGGGGIGQTYPGSCGDVPFNSYHQPVLRHNGEFVQTRGYCTDVFFDSAWQWMSTNNVRNQRFFAFITPNAPHDPFVPPSPEWVKPFLDKGLSPMVASYYSMIANIDANVGTLLDRLAAANMETNTLILFMTDNGHGMSGLYNAGMRGAKGGPYQGGTRVPSFWRWKNVLPQGVDCPRLAAHIDLLPTLLEIAGSTTASQTSADTPELWEGRSLVPLLRHPEAHWPDRTLFIHLGRWESGEGAAAKWKSCAVRTSRYRLINGVELYDILKDPGETQDIAAERPEVVQELRSTYESWWTGILPDAVQNDDVLGPPINPWKAAYWESHPVPRDAGLLERMNPALKFMPNRPRL